MAAAEGEKKMITLRSSDGVEFEVEEAVAMESQTMAHMIEDDCAGNGISLPDVSGKTLAKVIEYCKKHVVQSAGDAASGVELKAFDAEFVNVDIDTLYYLLHAANYLSIKGLLDLMCQTVADMIAAKTPEQIRQTFNIKNDFPQEEQDIRKEILLAFE